MILFFFILIFQTLPDRISSILIPSSNIKFSMHNYVYSCFAIHFFDTHFMAIGKYSSDSTVGVLYSDGLTLEPHAMAYTGFPLTARVRSISSNPTLSQKSYLFMLNRNILYFTQTSVNGIVVSPANQTLTDSCFGSVAQEVFILKKNANSQYVLIFVKNFIQIIRINLPVLKTLTFVDMRYQTNQLFITFRGKILVYELTGDLLTIKQNMDFPVIGSSVLINVDLNIQYFFLTNQNKITIFDLVDFTVYWETTVVNSIDSIAVKHPFLFIKANTQIFHIDYSENVKSEISKFTSDWLTSELMIRYYGPGKGLVVLKKATSLPKQDYWLLEIAYYYECSVPCSCHQGYYFYAPNLCKFANQLPPEQDLIDQDPIIPVPGTDENPDPTDPTNPIDPIDPIDPIEPSGNETPLPQQPQTFLNEIPEHILSTVTQTVGKVMSFTSMRVSPNFLLSFTGFLDDLWLYKFHRRQYPSSVKFFMEQVSIINELRLSPWFLNFLNFINQRFVCIQENKKLYEFLDLSQNDPTEVYFLHSAEDTYKNNLIMNGLFWLTLKALLLLLNKIHKEGVSRKESKKQRLSFCDKFLKSLVRGIKSGSRWWILLNSIVESNMLKLSFDCFLQLLLPSSFKFMDKFNFSFTVMVLFLLLFYCICFYPLIFRNEKQDYSQILLTKSKFRLRSFYFESIFIVCKNFARSFVHAYFMFNHRIQITLLTIVDFMIFCFGIKMRSCFCYKAVAILSIFYSFSFFVFDFYFSIVAFTHLQDPEQLNEEFVALILVLILISTSILTMLCMFLITFIEIVQEIRMECKIGNLIEHAQDKILKKRSSSHFSSIKTVKSIKKQKIIKKLSFQEIDKKNIFQRDQEISISIRHEKTLKIKQKIQTKTLKIAKIEILKIENKTSKFNSESQSQQEWN